MLAMFVRLTAGEEMPKRERIWRSVYPPSASIAAAGARIITGRQRGCRCQRTPDHAGG